MLLDAEKVEMLEDRVNRLEDDVRTLSSLPAKFDALIELQKENNQDIKDLTRCMNENYPSKEMVKLMINNSKSEVELKVYGAIAGGILGLIAMIAEFIKLLH
jgi:uncharacterized protein with PhoU and TrkA domain